MKVLRTLAITCLVLLAGLGIVSAQTWTPLTHPPTFAASTALLLTDGTVMVQETRLAASPAPEFLVRQLAA